MIIYPDRRSVDIADPWNSGDRVNWDTMQATWRLRRIKQKMALHFPNQSRSYDSRRRAVRFWGHDGAMEAAFFVSEEALKRLQPRMLGEAEVLGAFDANRPVIYAAAARVYARGPKGSYDLETADF